MIKCNRCTVCNRCVTDDFRTSVTAINLENTLRQSFCNGCNRCF
ncbi:hypothetical protein [Anaerococcus vaginalis]|nr:hypothetical protein [Anaerococcus vaginalis]MDU2374739.1 hypothetical protein [Anaerococcus vaginalis]